MPSRGQQEAIQALLVRSGRAFVPLRRAFVQAPPPTKGAGPLAAFTKRQPALDLYLLVHALASRAPWDVRLPARVWVRLLGGDEKSPASAALVARQWSWLEARRLIATQRVGRQRRIVLLREDGSGDPYTHPGTGSPSAPPEGNYFRLPHAYWTGAFFERLDLAAKSVLLIALSLRDDFILPVEHGAGWYGMSADRLHSGLKTLRALNILSMRVERRSAPLTDRGFTFERHYTLRAPFRDLDELEVAPRQQT